MIVLLIAAAVLAYIAVGVGFIFLLGIEPDFNSPYMPMVVGLFWPIVAPVVGVMLLVVATSAMFEWAARKGAGK